MVKPAAREAHVLRIAGNHAGGGIVLIKAKRPDSAERIDRRVRGVISKRKYRLISGRSPQKLYRLPVRPADDSTVDRSRRYGQRAIFDWGKSRRVIDQIFDEITTLARGSVVICSWQTRAAIGFGARSTHRFHTLRRRSGDTDSCATQRYSGRRKDNYRYSRCPCISLLSKTLVDQHQQPYKIADGMFVFVAITNTECDVHVCVETRKVVIVGYDDCAACIRAYSKCSKVVDTNEVASWQWKYRCHGVRNPVAIAPETFSSR